MHSSAEQTECVMTWPSLQALSTVPSLILLIAYHNICLKFSFIETEICDTILDRMRCSEKAFKRRHFCFVFSYCGFGVGDIIIKEVHREIGMIISISKAVMKRCRFVDVAQLLITPLVGLIIKYLPLI